MENRNRKLFLALRVGGIWRSTDDLVAHLHCSWGPALLQSPFASLLTLAAGGTGGNPELHNSGGALMKNAL